MILHVIFYDSIPDNPQYMMENNVLRTTSKDIFLNVQKTQGGDMRYHLYHSKRNFFKFTSYIDFPHQTLPTSRPPFFPAENYDFRRRNNINKKVYLENEANPIVEEIFEYDETIIQTITMKIIFRFTGMAA